MTLATGVSMFSKVRLFLSLQIVHMRQEGIKFQTPEDLFPNQFHQPNNKFGTLSGSTQSIPTNWKTKFQSCRANQQCKRRWSTVSSAFLHIQHQPANTKPFFFKLSQVRIRPQAICFFTYSKILWRVSPLHLFYMCTATFCFFFTCNWMLHSFDSYLRND